MKYFGVVQRGDRRGTAIGFPTANISFDGHESGIFAATAHVDGKEFIAAVYADQKRRVLEAYLDGYSGGDLYGEKLEIELLEKIREDKRFDAEDALKSAIANDVRMVRQFFSSRIRSSSI